MITRFLNIALFCVCIIFFSIAIIFYSFGFIVNFTKSMPLGLYQIIKTDGIQKDDLVVFRIPQKDELLLKQVVAIGGDKIKVNRSGVYINDKYQPNSKIFDKDTKGYPIKFIESNQILGSDEIFVMGKDIKSYDSRYFGIVKLNKSIQKAKPILIWDSYNG